MHAKDPFLAQTAQKEVRAQMENLQSMLELYYHSDGKLSSVLLPLLREVLAKSIKRDDVLDISFNLLTELEQLEQKHPEKVLPFNLKSAINNFFQIKNLPLQLQLATQTLTPLTKTKSKVPSR